jgi:hypothetical protein
MTDCLKPKVIVGAYVIFLIGDWITDDSNSKLAYNLQVTT